jgi:Ran GTPase-activating protein (RanGAP) involved in mRNA processing and transport
MKKVLTLCGHEEMEGYLERNLEQAREDVLVTSVELKHFVWNDAKARAVDGFFQCNNIRSSLDELMVQSCTGLGPPFWTSMPFLKRLTLSMVNISLPLLFPPSLQELSLFEVSLSEDVAAALGKSLAQPASCCLKKLDLTDSRFLANGVNLLAQGLAHNKSLSSLSVSECNLMDEQVSVLVRALEYHTSIQELDISFNKCRHFGVNALTSLLLSNVCRLSKLSMDFQAFGECKSINLDPILAAISSSPWPSPSSISRHGSFLVDLGLGGNSLRDLQMPSLVDALCSNHALEKLDLSENRFTDVGIELLAKRLHEMKGLK